MADLIRIKGGALGNRVQMPQLRYDKEKGHEIGYRSDEKALYIGTADGNVRLCGAEDLTEIIARLDDITARLDSLTSSE